MDRITVLICDDHAIVREGTKKLLEQESDIEVVGEARDGAEAVEKARSLRPRVVAMDIAMPGMNGIEATRKIKSILPETAVIALTAYDDLPYISAILESGAAGYILKSARSEELILAIRAAATGDAVLSRSVAQKVFSRGMRLTSAGQVGSGATRSPAAGHSLTEKEIEVLKLASKGLSNKEIASELGISPRTVQSHMASIFGKMAVGSRTEAVFEALKRGLIAPPDVEMR
ncbi:MAG TPA: response regulator transcription factor [Firmicutes bacterium]|nr:response regulator transcription factor [Candidatus Fermentithermobacillaceae bacterium]